MELNEFQRQAMRTAVYPGRGLPEGRFYIILGLVGEAGELANKYKKCLRGDGNIDKIALVKELGDVLWFVAALADELDADLEDIAKLLLGKLADRADRGVIKGSGDDR